MTKKAKSSDIIEIISSALAVDATTLNGDTESDDVPGWDSLGHLRVCLALEERFGVAIDMETMATLNSVPKMVALVNAQP